MVDFDGCGAELMVSITETQRVDDEQHQVGARNVVYTVRSTEL